MQRLGAVSSVPARRGKSADRETAKEGAAEDREEVAHVHCHDSQHTKEKVSDVFLGAVGRGSIEVELTVDNQHQQ